MIEFIIATFVIGYSLIILEDKIKINKAATAIYTGVLCWVIFIIFSPAKEEITSSLTEHLGSISQIIFFLLGAMTIVELIDSHDGFDVITSRIKTRNKKSLLWVIGIFTFFLSAILDNLTTAIVMITLVRKILDDKNDKYLFAGIIIIAANAGGAWSPMGDITTTMLWIGGQITAGNVIYKLFIPSLISYIIPSLIITMQVKGQIQIKNNDALNTQLGNEKYVVLIAGLFSLFFVPAFKTITGLPPFMGILLGLSALWIITEFLHKDKAKEEQITVSKILQKIDTPSILFFLGILLTVAAMESTGILHHLSQFLSDKIGNLKIISASLGVISSVIDNVPLVAASMGMYSKYIYPTNHYLWELIAYCAGTGGSILLIGSAAGVAVMGIEKIPFVWYLKKISLPALIGYIAGFLVYLVMFPN